MSCLIDQGSAFDCESITQGGIGNYVYLINKTNFDNYQTLTIDTGLTEEITALVLEAGSQGYKFVAPKGNMHVTPSSPFRSATARDGFDHTMYIVAHDVSQVSRENIAKLLYNKVVAIVPLLSGKFLLYGRYVGMRISDYQENPGDADLGGTIQFTLKTPDSDPPEIATPHIIASTFDITSLDSPAA